MAEVGFVGQGHLKDADIPNDRSADGGDEEQTCCNEEECDSDPGEGLVLDIGVE